MKRSLFAVAMATFALSGVAKADLFNGQVRVESAAKNVAQQADDFSRALRYERVSLQLEDSVRNFERVASDFADLAGRVRTPVQLQFAYQNLQANYRATLNTVYAYRRNRDVNFLNLQQSMNRLEDLANRFIGGVVVQPIPFPQPLPFPQPFPRPFPHPRPFPQPFPFPGPHPFPGPVFPLGN